MKLDITVSPFGKVTTNGGPVTDWYGAQKRAEEKLARALKRREDAEFAHQQAEAEVERIKMAARREAQARAAANQGAK